MVVKGALRDKCFFFYKWLINFLLFNKVVYDYISISGHIVSALSVRLSVCLSAENIIFGHSFCMVSDRAILDTKAKVIYQGQAQI